MFYKTKKDTETGKKFTELLKQKQLAINAQHNFSKKYGFKTYRGAYWQVWGGFSSCLEFNDTPDSKIWGKGAKDGEFYPKRNSKAGKKIYNEFNEMPCVSRESLNKCVDENYDSFNKIGFAFNNDYYYGFITDKKWGMIIPNDCNEITESEYDKIFK